MSARPGLRAAVNSKCHECIVDPLDISDMDTVGLVTGIAPGEQIQAVRMMADVGYVVTFERIDDWVGGIGGLLSLGRQGLFAHDNTHHALATARAAADCVGVDAAIDRVRWERARGEFAAISRGMPIPSASISAWLG